MMKCLFEQLRDNIEALLVANQGTLFRTIVGQRERTDASEVKDGLRTLQVFTSPVNTRTARAESNRKNMNVNTDLNIN
jgi:hypothetical protein